MSRKRFAEHTSLAANNIHMDTVGQTRTAATAAAATRENGDDDFEESTEMLAERSKAVVSSATVGLGFHSGFLDDDEPSALSPEYRDEPDSARTVRTPRVGRDES